MPPHFGSTSASEPLYLRNTDTAMGRKKATHHTAAAKLRNYRAELTAAISSSASPPPLLSPALESWIPEQPLEMTDDSDVENQTEPAWSEDSEPDWDGVSVGDEFDANKLQGEAASLAFASRLQDGINRELARVAKQRLECNRPRHYTGQAASTLRAHRARGRREEQSGTTSIAKIFTPVDKKARAQAQAAAALAASTEEANEILRSDAGPRPARRQFSASTRLIVSDDEDESGCSSEMEDNLVFIAASDVADLAGSVGEEMPSSFEPPTPETPNLLEIETEIDSEDESQPTTNSQLKRARSYSACDSDDEPVAKRSRGSDASETGSERSNLEPTAAQDTFTRTTSLTHLALLPWEDVKGMRVACDKLTAMLKKATHDVFFRRRLDSMRETLNLRLDAELNLSMRQASKIVAKAVGRGTKHQAQIRQWIWAFMRDGLLPTHQLGQFSTSALQDEDFARQIHLHLLELSGNGQYISAADVVAFVSSDAMQEYLGDKVTISERTARRWLAAMDWRFGNDSKGMYIDGHERIDVVQYHDKFLARWKEYECRMRLLDGDGTVISEPDLQPDQRQLVLYTHDESTFYAHDRRKTKWTHSDIGPTPQAKGEGESLMIGDFLSPEYGRLVSGDRCVLVLLCQDLKLNRHSELRACCLEQEKVVTATWMARLCSEKRPLPSTSLRHGILNVKCLGCLTMQPHTSSDLQMAFLPAK